MKIGELSVGATVKLKESGVAQQYIIVHKGKPSDMYDDSCDGVWLMRKNLLSELRYWHLASGYYNDYANSNIHKWLNNEFLDTLGSDMAASIDTVKIPHRPGNSYTSANVSSGADGLACKVFLLSACEVGGLTKYNTADSTRIPVDGSLLSYFIEGTSSSANQKRTAVTDDGVCPIVWWLRTPLFNNSTYKLAYVYNEKSNGTFTEGFSNGEYGVRPALIIPSTREVDSSYCVLPNTAPVIESETASGTDLGEISDAPAFSYSVSDEDSDPMTVSEYVDDTLTRTFDSAEGGTYTFGAVSGDNWKTVLNGQHTLKIIANDEKADSEPYTVTFNKQKKTATISLAEPLPADDVIKAVAITVTGKFPEDSTLSVLVTNNALDDSPIWEDMTASVLNSSNHVFTNQTAANGFAFNFIVTATRGASGEQGFIASIGGAFE